MLSPIFAQQLYAYQDNATGQRTVIATAADATGSQSFTNNIVYWDANGAMQSIFTPAVGGLDVRMVNSRDYTYFTDGVAADLKKWTISGSTSKWGIAAPVSALSFTLAGSGAITILTGRNYYTVYENSVTGHYSGLSPISASTGALTSDNVSITGIPVSSDSQVDKKIILATADGGDPATLYFVVELANATTTYTDSTDEPTLLFNNVFLYTDDSAIDHGVANNNPPPNGSYPTAHRGRIFMASGETLAFSKSLDEVITSTGVIAGRYEECWPTENQLLVSQTAEQIRGLLSDGTALYIGTELHIRRLLGDSPDTFVEPDVSFSNTGLLTQNVWQVVYLEGTPIGMMWITPDLRLMASDFNTYDNVGTAVQTTLNTINRSAVDNCWAMFVGNGPYSFYVLFLATGTNTVPDTMLVYDLHLRQWFTWKCLDGFTAGLYYVNISGIARWMVIDQTGQMRAFDSSYVMDRQGDSTQAGITSTVKSVWLNFGDDTTRKALNEIEVITSDSTATLTVEGASTATQFVTPNGVVTSSALSTSPFGDFKVYLAGQVTKDRNYRLTFNSISNTNSTSDDILLSYMSAEVYPLHRF